MYLFQVDIQPRLSDFDLYGHLNNTHYVSYTEVAMYNVLVYELGFDHTQYGAITRHMSFDFDKPIRFGVPVAIQTKIIQMANSIISVEHQFVSASNPEKVFATAKRTMVLVSLADGKPAAIPESVLKTYEAKLSANADQAISAVA